MLRYSSCSYTPKAWKMQKAKLERSRKRNLEEQNTIEDVTSEATPWLSQLVIVPKPGNEIRLRIDMCSANVAFQRTRFPTPTFDDLIFRLKNTQ